VTTILEAPPVTSAELPLAAAPDGAARSVGLAWKEARPLVQVIFQMRFLAAALLAIRAGAGTPHGGRLVVGALAWLCSTWHVYLLNGLSDGTSDRLNGSTRPLASDRLSIGAAQKVLAALTVLALGLGALGGWQLLVLVTAMLGLGYGYSAGPWPLKASVPGAMTVILAGGLGTYLAGWYAAGGAAPTAGFLIVAGAMSLWMALAGMAKDRPDVDGDRAAGRRTLPILLGERRTRLLIAALALGVAVTALLIALGNHVQRPFAGTLLVGACLMAVRLIARQGPDRRRPYRLFMATQYAAHLMVIGESCW
jgi:4-hydroxybenzoate polyprenyltransferase